MSPYVNLGWHSRCDRYNRHAERVPSAGFGTPPRTFERVKCSRDAHRHDCELVGALISPARRRAEVGGGGNSDELVVGGALALRERGGGWADCGGVVGLAGNARQRACGAGGSVF